MRRLRVRVGGGAGREPGGCVLPEGGAAVGGAPPQQVEAGARRPCNLDTPRVPATLSLDGRVFVVATVVGWWLCSTFLVSKQGFSRVYPVSAYVDADGDFTSVCVQRWAARVLWEVGSFCEVWAERRGVSGGAGGEARRRPGLAGRALHPRHLAGADTNHRRRQ